MSQTTARCLILACGNTLREDDGVGPWLAEWAENRFQAEDSVRVLSRQQWTPELAEEIACAESVLFIDCSAEAAPGSIQLISVQAGTSAQGLATHHLDAAELLALADKFYASLPLHAQLLMVGAGSTELGEEFSSAVTAALPAACRLIEETVLRSIQHSE
ncbi:MAG TPA: hydrogenase maturation protease [Terracidiphilus sp.]|jgi:hydrogenase maturation protease|nr:hydrogenase maturation protease [Terracidiphilus sp.]